MAHTYAHLYGLRATGLRFFTVYGPWGRPDMAPLLFSRGGAAGRPIDVFNHGRMRRDFTFIDDIVAGVLGALDQRRRTDARAAAPRLQSRQPHAGGTGTLHRVIERAAGRPAQKVYKPMQPGDMIETMADTRARKAAFGFEPSTSIDVGLPRWSTGAAPISATGLNANIRSSPSSSRCSTSRTTSRRWCTRSVALRGALPWRISNRLRRRPFARRHARRAARSRPKCRNCA
jgi:hypothetical protein